MACPVGPKHSISSASKSIIAIQGNLFAQRNMMIADDPYAGPMTRAKVNALAAKIAQQVKIYFHMKESLQSWRDLLDLANLLRKWPSLLTTTKYLQGHHAIYGN